MSYNLANQMISALGNSYTYDGHNRRVKVAGNGDTRYSLYSQAGQLLFSEENGVPTTYIYLGSKLIAEESQGETIFIHSDMLGSPVARTNADGTVQSRRHYKPFGDTYETPSDDIGYTGHKYDDDLGLSYMQARYYDPVIGRFYSNDPVGFIGDNVHSFGRYTYVNNNPFKYVDPDGKYGRGSNWTDEQWEKFDTAQKALGEKMTGASKSLKSKAAGLKEGETTKDGYSSVDLTSMAASLDKGIAAINDNGTGGHFANAVSMEGNVAGTGAVGGKTINMNTSHVNFGNNQSTQFTIGHESLHNAGLAHPKYMGFVPYRFGSFGQKMSYKNLPKHKQVTNPDHIMSQVFP